MQSLTLELTAQVKRLHVCVTAVINESRLVTKEHWVYTKWEELAVISLLNLLFALFFVRWLIHIEKITQTLVIVEWSTHVTMLFSQYFTFIFAQKRSLLDIFHREESPHWFITLLDPSDLHVILGSIVSCHQKVVAARFYAITWRMTLIKTENLIVWTERSHLESDFVRFVSLSVELIGWASKFVIPFVTNTIFRILTSVCTGTKRCPFDFWLVLFNIFVQSQIFLNVLQDQK